MILKKPKRTSALPSRPRPGPLPASKVQSDPCQFAEFDKHNSDTHKLAGLKNRALVAAAEAADSGLIITTDQEIPYQQNLAARRIAIMVLCAPTNRLAELRPLVPLAMERLNAIQPGQVIRIP